MPFLKPIKVSISKLRIESVKRNGTRHSTFNADKTKYAGEWKEDKKSGKGIQYTSENFLYEGNWSEGKRHGFGILSKNLKNQVYCKRYAGNWINGKKQGFGVNWYPDGSYFEGMFWQNKRQGFGRFWFQNGFYQGNWKNDLFHGKGILIQANGSRYEGDFYSGKKQGLGKFFNLKNHQIQEGFWQNDICQESVIRDFSNSIPELTLKNAEQILEERKIELVKLMDEKWRNNPPVEAKDYILNCL